MATAGDNNSLSKIFKLMEKIIEGWALAGGVLLLMVVLVTAYSMAGNILFAKPVPGDFEIVQIGVAVAVFAFLPYCQITDSNVSADIFTARAGPKLVAVFALIASVIALAFSILLLWRMSLGMLDYRKYEEITMVYQFPIWMAYVPILVSLFLLSIASLMTSIRSLQQTRYPVPDTLESVILKSCK